MVFDLDFKKDESREPLERCLGVSVFFLLTGGGGFATLRCCTFVAPFECQHSV